MKALLDTHAFLWWITNDSRLSARVLRLVRDPSTSVYLSVASGWEIAIKVGLGKLIEGMPLVTSDPLIQHYPVQTIW